jgi:hypothetical protein
VEVGPLLARVARRRPDVYLAGQTGRNLLKPAYRTAQPWFTEVSNWAGIRHTKTLLPPIRKKCPAVNTNGILHFNPLRIGKKRWYMCESDCPGKEARASELVKDEI